jgi:glycosyltransferase involved in cell wall biosynthesis
MYVHNFLCGGAETMVAKYLIHLKQHNVDVVAVVNNYVGTNLENQLRNANIPIVPLFYSPNIRFIGSVVRVLSRKFCNVSKRWKDIIEKYNPDIIHINTGISFFPSDIIETERLCYTFHGSVKIFQKSDPQYVPPLEHLAKNGMTFFALNQTLEHDIHQLFGTTNIVYTPNGVDVKTIRAKKYNKGEFLTQIGLDSESFVVGHVGRIHPVKNHKKLLSVFAEIKKLKKNAILLLVGTGKQSYINELKEYAKEKGILQDVHFLGLRNDATQITSIMDVFILPSLSETFSLVLVEAQSHGVRSIASDRVPESVICNDNCFRLPLESSDSEWATLAVSDSKEVHNRNVEDFDIDATTQILITQYKKIIDRYNENRNPHIS